MYAIKHCEITRREISFFFFYRLAAVGVLRKNSRGIIDLCKRNFHDNQSNMEGIADLKTDNAQIKKDIAQVAFQIKMDIDDVSQYFPANSNDDINRFLKNDEDYPSRRRGLYDLLKTTVSTNKKRFSDTFLHTLFTVKYKSEARWPCPKYVFLMHFFFQCNTFLSRFFNASS